MHVAQPSISTSREAICEPDTIPYNVDRRIEPGLGHTSGKGYNYIADFLSKGPPIRVAAIGKKKKRIYISQV